VSAPGMSDQPLPPPVPGTEAEPEVQPMPGATAGRPRVVHGPQPDTLFGLQFESVNRAQQFMLALAQLRLDDKLHLLDAVMVVKDEHDRVRVRETIDPQPGRTAISSGMWTGLLGLIVGGPVGWIAGIGIGAGVGAVTAKVIDLGIPDEWVKWFKLAVQPGTAIVVVLASDIDQPALRAEVERFPGVQLVHTTVHTEALAELASTIDGDAAPVTPD
jgi:uncharacterized membrane protein